MEAGEKILKRVLDIAIKEQASDVHFSPGQPPILRVFGNLFPLLKEKIITKEDAENIAFLMLNESQKERLLKEKDIDFSYDFDGRVRFRVNIFFTMGKIAIAMRLISSKIRTIEELNLPPILHQFTKAQQGFVLVCGPASHGKSTTLASMIDEINHTRLEHIITIEDPIEYVFENDRSVIDQREVGKDALSFARALKAALRQDPDVIMVGEMRDPETMAIAITAAETGHLVFTTLHTNSAAQTINRIVDSFPAEQQAQVRSQLSHSLLGIISQRLVPRTRGGLIPACEIMLNTPAISTLIRENKIHEIPTVIETSADVGMITLNRSLADLLKRGEISFENALNYSLNPVELRMLLS